MNSLRPLPDRFIPKLAVNWVEQDFQSCALPTELPVPGFGKIRENCPKERERAELQTAIILVSVSTVIFNRSKRYRYTWTADPSIFSRGDGF